MGMDVLHRWCAHAASHAAAGWGGGGGSCKIRELVLIREKALFGFPGCSVWKCLHGHLELLRNLECMEYKVWSMEL